MFNTITRFFSLFHFFFKNAVYCYKYDLKTKPLNIKHYEIPTQGKYIIPKILYQTHESEYLQWSIYSASAQTIYMNPNYEYQFYNAVERRNIISELFGEESRELKAYDMFRDGTSKSDIFRLCILYKKGGVYMDCKGATIKPLDIFIPKDSNFAIFQDICETPRFTTSFIASSPSNFIIQRLLDEAVSRVLDRRYGASVLDIAGPDMFGTVLCDLLGEENMKPGRVIYDGINIDIIGKSNLYDSYMYGPSGPLIKRQPDNYYFNWKRIICRYEISWVLGRTFSE